jgi:hypothetical protein
VETVDLLNLLNDYNAKIADLTTQEQMVVADIVSKRYLATVEKLIHDQKMVTKSGEIQAADDTWTAKFAALSSDQAALDTLSTRVLSENEKTTARISEIQSYIGIESYNLSAVDIDIAEKEIQSSKVDLAKLDAANAVLKIQMDIVNAAMQLVEVDLQIARTRVDIANTDQNISRIGLKENDLTIAQAQTQIEQAGIPIAEARVTLADAKSAEADKELDYYGTTLLDQAGTEFQNKTDLQNVRHVAKEAELTQRKEEKELNMDNRLATENLDITFANLDAAKQVVLDEQSASVMRNQGSNAWSVAHAAVTAAEKLAVAHIGSELTHTVGKKKQPQP